MDLTALFPSMIQRYGLRTPQGFDAFQPQQYKNLMSRIEHVRPPNNWEIDINPANEVALRLLGIRYFITAEDRALYQQLLANPHFRRLAPSYSFYTVFEFLNTRPPYGWESDGAERTVSRTRWTPEVREFLVRSETGLPLHAVRKFFPRLACGGGREARAY